MSKMHKTAKAKNRKDEVYTLAPKGIFETCLIDLGLAEPGDSRIDTAFELFEERMRRFGYVDDAGRKWKRK